MTIAFVLGNGISRQSVDPVILTTLGSTYGCNAISRDFAPTVLVSTDAPISKHIQESGYSQKNVHYTRRPLSSLGAKRIPQQFYGFSSGPAAVGIAALDQKQKIYLIGFDMGPTQIGNFNNVYAGTEFYKKASAVPTYTGNWVRQIIEIIKTFSKIQFVRVQGETTANIAEFDAVPNLAHMPMTEFLSRINNTKDL